jgi:hypothetical protein
MSEITLKDKVVLQASRLAVMDLQINFLLRELYKTKPDHEVFSANKNLAATVQAAVDSEAKNAKKPEDSKE